MKVTNNRENALINHKCFRCPACLVKSIFTMAPYKLQHIWMAVNNVFNFSWVQNVHWMNEKPTHHKPYKPAPIEQIANVVTHGVWVVPSIIACFALIQRATSWPQYWSAVIYGTALVLLFSVSTFFHSVFYCSHNRTPRTSQSARFAIGNGQSSLCICHVTRSDLQPDAATVRITLTNEWLPQDRQLKDMLHRGDRAMIYVFIAASYFPWLMLTPLPLEGLAAELHWVVWVLASLGILYQQLFHEQYKCLEIFFYLVMGITPSFAIVTKMEEFLGLTELKIGGLVYIFGVIFFKADGKIPCAHAIWHMFVVMAAGIHYYAILNYLYPTMEIYT